MKIYMAGPLFTAAELAFNRQLKHLLEKAGHEVWLPQEKEPRAKGARAIFERDVEGIDWAGVVVANMDGPDPDSGTCWECGYAYNKKPVLVYRTDFRAADDPNIGPFNLMLTQSSAQVLDLRFKGLEDVASALIDAMKRYER